MHSLPEHQLLITLLAIGIILLVGRATAHLATHFNQPEVLGELIGGFILGPSVLGALAPAIYKGLFLEPQADLALSAFAWVGAVLVLLIAGMEAELRLLKQHAKAGSLAALFCTVSSVVVGTVFGAFAMHEKIVSAIFLGVVLSVTAVSVAAKILLEREVLRRGYAQVILAAGIASEVVVWLFISVLAAISSGHGNPWFEGLKATGFAILFFMAMMTIGRRITYWSMRRVADWTTLASGVTSLVVILAFFASALTQWMGLHALLGAFVFGVVLGESPRANIKLKENIQTLAVSFFGPIFFVLAGMRVDIFKVGGWDALLLIVALFVVATLFKVGPGTLGAKLGGLPGWEPLMVGIGVNFKGGTDVIVAILGSEMGLLSSRDYSLYAVVSILTVLVSPKILAWLEEKSPPTSQEQERLNREEARRRAYLSDVERVLAPVIPELLPNATAHILETIARGKQDQSENFDINQFSPVQDSSGHTGACTSSDLPERSVEQAEASLSSANQLQHTELTKQQVNCENPVEAVLKAAGDYRVIAIGARRPHGAGLLTFGRLQDPIIDGAQTDVLVVVENGSPEDLKKPIKRILVPVNGMEYSMAAADVAAYIAKGQDAEVVFMNVMDNDLDFLFWRESAHRDLLEAGYQIVREVSFRAERLDVKTRERVRLGSDPAEAITNELKRNNYDLVVMGVVDRSGTRGLYLGRTPQKVMLAVDCPVILLVSHTQAA